MRTEPGTSFTTGADQSRLREVLCLKPDYAKARANLEDAPRRRAPGAP